MAPVIQAQQSTSQVVRHADGSFTVTGPEGSVGMIPLEGATGRVLQSGESVNILPSGELDIALARAGSGGDTNANARVEAEPCRAGFRDATAARDSRTGGAA